MMEYQFTRGIQRPNAARLSLALSSVMQESQREMVGANAYQESSKISKLAVPTKTPYSVLSSGSFYSQDSWDGPEAWAFNKPPPSSKRAGPAIFAAANAPPPRDSTISSSTTLQGSDSIRLNPNSPRNSYITTDSGQTTLVGIESTLENEGSKKEKKTKLRQMYKRASMSTKAFAKMFSRSPGSGRSPPSGGVAKRSSLKPPLPIVSPSKDLLNPDPFASGHFASSKSITPPETKRPTLTHKRAGSSPDARLQISVDVQKQLKRSPSVSSPLGVPVSPLLARSSQNLQQSIRGRDSPFPVNSSNLSLPLLGQRRRSSSQSSTTSIGAQAMIPKSQNQTQPPILRIPSSSSLRAQARQSPPNPAPNHPPPQVPFPPPVPGPVQVDVPRQVSTVTQRPRAKSVRETQRPRLTSTGTESSPHQPQRKLGAPHDDKLDTVNSEKSLFLDTPPSNGSRHLVQGLAGLNAKYTSVRVHEVHVVAPSPSMPAMRAAFLSSAPPLPNSETNFKRRPRAGSTSADGARRDLDPPSVGSEVPENLEVSEKSSELDRLPDRIPQQRTMSKKAPRYTPPMRAGTQLEVNQKPSLPLLVTQNLPPAEDVEPRAGSLRSQHSIRRIPRSPSMPSLRPDFCNTPQLMSKAGPRPDGSDARSGISDGLRVRSPSLPNSDSATIPSGAVALDKEKRQPLPSSVAERLRSRPRSNSQSGDRPPHVHSSHSRPPSTTREGEKLLEPIPSASADKSTYSPPRRPGSATSNLQTPPPPSVSNLLRERVGNRPHERGLKSPSMPDLHANPLNNSSRNRRQHSPPPPLPPTIRRPALEPTPRAAKLQISANPASYDTKREPTPNGPKSNSLASTTFLRPNANLTRPKELSYPQTKSSTRNFHARSNKELAKEGGWDFLDAPPRPPRSPLAQRGSTDLPQTAARSRSNSLKVVNPGVLSLPVTQIRKTPPRAGVVGMAL